MTLGEAVAYYEVTPPRGEYVLVVEGAAPSVGNAVTLSDAAESVLQRYRDGLRLKDAAAQVAKETGFPRNQLYAAALELRGAETESVDAETESSGAET